ncbi:Abi family protein [Ligilactobacillus equi]|uniref:Abi family protein n=1 Tax=Ligilactobacillus equi TaxID=137357 RepID=UPI00046A4541|nr:Abi family protein [Ligilactobacillus equi]
MNKVFKSVEEQIKLLESRGLKFSDKAKAQAYLLTNNYYSIINGYSKIFMDSDSDKYISGATFDEIISLYFFNRELRKTLLDSLLLAEHHLKSILAYRFEEYYQGKKEAYLDVSSFNHEKSLDISYIITKISRTITNKSRYKNNAINHYREKYNFVPLWVMVEFLEFGDILTLIKVLPTDLQNKIAHDCYNFIKRENKDSEHGQFSPNIMISFIEVLKDLRNACAHDDVLLNFNSIKTAIYYPYLHDIHDSIIRDDDKTRRTVYCAMIILECFISNNEFAILNNTVRKRFRNLENKVHSVSLDKILSELGFPQEWQRRDPLPQLS